MENTTSNSVGVVVLTVLSHLRTAQDGYSLRQALADERMPIEVGTLYPLLRRLESLGLLVSEWRIEDGPPCRYFTLSPAGRPKPSSCLCRRAPAGGQSGLVGLLCSLPAGAAGRIGPAEAEAARGSGRAGRATARDVACDAGHSPE
jgi:hypothetical protein